MKILKGDRDDQYRCTNSQDMLVGLITKVPDGRWRIELFMRVDGVADTEKEAVAFAHGAWATAEAYGFNRNQIPVVPTVEKRNARPQAPKG